MLRQIVLVGVLLAMIAVVPAQANVVQKIEVTIAYGGDTIFDARDPLDTSQLTWQGGSGAVVLKDTGSMFMATDCDIAASFSTMADNSAGGVASAKFYTGSWNVTLYDYVDGDLVNDFEVMALGGTLSWYTEVETNPDEMTGVGIVNPETWWVDFDHPFFGGGVEWGMGPNGKSGISAQTSGLSLDPANYAVDFTGDSLTLVIFADSTYIPEPATMLLLGIGALFCRRRHG